MTAKELYNKYQADLTKLQSACTHPQISDWMDEEWAPGHLTDRRVKICEVCNSIVEVYKVKWVHPE